MKNLKYKIKSLFKSFTGFIHNVRCKLEKIFIYFIIMTTPKNIKTKNKSLKEHLGELKENWGIYFITMLQPDNLPKILIYLFIITISFIVSIVYDNPDNKWVNIIAVIIGAVSVNLFSSHLYSLRNDSKLIIKGESAVRNIENILRTIGLIKKANKIGENFEILKNQTILLIEDWRDIIPNLNYRDLLNEMTELNNKIEDLENNNVKIENEKNDEIKKLKQQLQEMVNLNRSYGWNSIPSLSGGTANNM